MLARLAGELAGAFRGAQDRTGHERGEPILGHENVTSPGGTTAAAMDILMAEDGLTALMTRAILRATERSRELAG